MRRIEPYRVWIGHAGDARNFGVLFEVGIRAIIQLALEEPPLAAPREFIVIRVPLVDGGNERELLDLAVTAVEQLLGSGLATLVCCSAGMSRSPAVTAVALSRLEQKPAEECLARITRNCAADVSTTLWKALSDMVVSKGDA